MQFYDSLEKLSFQYYAVITYRMLSLMATAYTTDINMDVANYFLDKGALKKEPFTKERKIWLTGSITNMVPIKLIMNHCVLAAPFKVKKNLYQTQCEISKQVHNPQLLMLNITISQTKKKLHHVQQH